MPKFEVEYSFVMVAHTRGWMIEAATAEEAVAKARECITADGNLDHDAAKRVGLDTSRGSWSTSDGSDHAYDVSMVRNEAGEVVFDDDDEVIF